MDGAMCTIIGFVATTPRMMETKYGETMASFRLGCSPGRYDKQTRSWVNGPRSFFTVVCFRGLAKNAATSLQRLDHVVVYGKLKAYEWERDGKSGTTVEVEATAIGHDLNLGTSMFARNQPSPGRDQSEQQRTKEELVRAVESEHVNAGDGGYPDVAGGSSVAAFGEQPSTGTDGGPTQTSPGTDARRGDDGPYADAERQPGAGRRAAA